MWLGSFVYFHMGDCEHTKIITVMSLNLVIIISYMVIRLLGQVKFYSLPTNLLHPAGEELQILCVSLL